MLSAADQSLRIGSPEAELSGRFPSESIFVRPTPDPVLMSGMYFALPQPKTRMMRLISSMCLLIGSHGLARGRRHGLLMPALVPARAAASGSPVRLSSRQPRLVQRRAWTKRPSSVPMGGANGGTPGPRHGLLAFRGRLLYAPRRGLDRCSVARRTLCCRSEHYPVRSVVAIAGLGTFLAVDTGTAVIERKAAREGPAAPTRKGTRWSSIFSSKAAARVRRLPPLLRSGPRSAGGHPARRPTTPRPRAAMFADEDWQKIQSKQL